MLRDYQEDFREAVPELIKKFDKTLVKGIKW